jgi:peptide/nickel transport system permease protein
MGWFNLHRLNLRTRTPTAPRFLFILLGAALTLLILSGAVIVPAFGSVGGTPGPSEARSLSIALGPVPVADAGNPQNATEGDTIYLNGNGSVPSDGATIVNYTWLVVFHNTNQTLYGVNPSFTVHGTGYVGINLTVSDSNGLTAWDDTYVVVKIRPATFLEQYWLDLVLLVVVVAFVGKVIFDGVKRVKTGQALVPEPTKEKGRLTMLRLRKILKQLLRNYMGLIGVIILSVFVFVAIFGPYIAPYDVHTIDLNNKFSLPSKEHWMGTDNFGVDIFSELLYGARTSIIVGMVSAVIASFLGAAVGLYSGYVGGWKDEVVMRLNDIVLSIPWLVLMIVVAALIGEIDLTGIILIIGLTGWSTTARMVRAQVLSVKERQYVERARAIGSSELAIIRRHIFPNTFPLVFANTILTVAVSILSEATLSFLGLRPVGVVTWGTMLSFASGSSAFQIGLQWWILAPGLCIVFVVLGFTLLGYALDEILNPKLRKR